MSEDSDPRWSRADDIQFEYEALPPTHPVYVARRFVELLLAEHPDLSVLASMVTPESLASWGDFQEASNKFKSMRGVGFAQRLLLPPGITDVLWIALVEGSEDEFEGLDATVPNDFEFINLVKRLDLGRWAVHAIGERLEPDDLPRFVPPEISR